MENDFDKQLHDALHDYEAEYDAADWADLEARLDEEPDRSLPPFWLKGLEALVFLLIVFTVYNFWGAEEESAAIAVQQGTGSSTEQTISSAVDKNNSSARSSSYAQQAIAGHSIKTSYPEGSANSSNSAIAESFKPKEPKSNIDAAFAQKRNTADKTKATNADKFLDQPIAKREVKQVTVVDDEVSNSQAAGLTQAQETLNEIERSWLSARLVLPLYPERLSGELIKERPHRTKMREPFKTEWRYGFLFSTDANSNSPYGRGRMGESLGFNLHALLSERLAIESGIGLSFKRFDYNGPLRQYDDDGNLEFNEQVRENRNTQITTFYIPLTLQYEVYENKKWRGYFTAGGSLRGVLWQRHEGTLGQVQSQENGQIQTTAEINAVGAERGLFQDGALADNYFLSWSLGLGLERQISNHWHLFVQPNYQQAFTGYGPRDSHFAAFSLNMGLRSTFNKFHK